jgi:predicted membrane protein
MDMDKCKSSKRFGFGIVVLLAGLVLLLGNLGMIPEPYNGVFMRWPMILVAIAFINFINREWLSGFILFAIGTFFLMHDLVPGFTYYDIWKFWPVFLILIGFAIIKGKHPKRGPHPISYHSNSEDVIEEVVIFGGNMSRVQSQNFKGGEITSIFGGSEVHFTDAVLSPEGAVLEMTAIFGGVKLIVPRDWHIKIEVSSILGGFNDKRVPAGDRADLSRTLTIKGTTIFGGGELISY